MRTRLFLRTAEFLWQEGHTAHATAGRGRGGGTHDPRSVSHLRRGLDGHAGAHRPQERRAEIPRGRLHAVHRGADAGRQGPASGHQPFPGPELRQGVRRQVPEPGGQAGVCLGDQLGRVDAAGRRPDHDAQRRPGPGAAAAAGAHPRRHCADFQDAGREGGRAGGGQQAGGGGARLAAARLARITSR